MGRIARVIESLANRIKANLNGSYNNECEYLEPAGDDSKPLPNDDGMTTKTGQSGRFTFFGIYDYDNKITSPGEKRIYGRDTDGSAVAQVYIKNSGEIESSNGAISSQLNPDGSGRIDNGSGYIEIQSSGIVDINGFIINPDGSASSPVSVSSPLVSAANSLIVDGKEQKDHNHEPGTYQAGGDNVTGLSGSQP